MSRAAIYVRVSSSEQVHGYSLDTQESACREYCTRNGWEIGGVFREEGESAKTADRPELQRMLVDVARKGAGFGFVVVYDLSRLARDTFDHLAIQRHLEQHGVRLRAASQNLEDSPEGKFVSTVLSATNELDNALRRRKTMAGMKEALARGRWPWHAPLGYRNRRSEDGRSKWVEPDPAIAPILRWAFEQAATGLRSKDEIRAELRGRGLKIPRASLYRVLRNPFYAGRVVAPEWGVDVAGAHEPLVDLATFRAAARGYSKHPAHVSGQTSDFPFRQFVRCASCGGGLTGYRARGRSGRRWPYYRCQRCSVNVRAGAVDQAFARLLDGLAPSAGMLDALELVVRDVTHGREARQRELAEAAARRLAAERQKRDRLVDAFVYRDALPETDYKRMRAELDGRIATLEHEVSTALSPAGKFEPVMRAAREFLQLPLLAWDRADAGRKPALLRGLFPEGLAWERTGTFRTPVKCLLQLPLLGETRASVASGTPSDDDFEPYQAWLTALEHLLPILEASPS